ncbi:MAG: hypothetical protein IT334_03125 [Thermomicrobiales bacterium]|nr:hypothetical protein [Thermomicrobiales bacterium]
MAQLFAPPDYNHALVERVVRYLETKETALFPFTAGFTWDEKMAFMRDLRRALGSLTDSGSARKTAAVGFIMSDDELEEVIDHWQRRGANG